MSLSRTQKTHIKKTFLFTAFFSLIGLQAFSQSGCTDPQATNYDPLAVDNDGSCVYPQTVLAPEKLCDWPSLMAETSGIEFWQNKLWSHNDGGNPATVEIMSDDRCTVESQLQMDEVINFDWEDMTIADDLIFIGDFGNNNGDRKNLSIQVFDLQGARISSTYFNYEDQLSFPSRNRNNAYDCEALLVQGNTAYVFTKDWINERTKLYTIDLRQDTVTAQLKDSLDIEGLVTASDISENSVIALLGYRKSSEVFLTLLFDYKGDEFFSGHKRTIILGTSILLGQMEGLTFVSPYEVLLSAESLAGQPPKLYRINIAEYVDHIVDLDRPFHSKDPISWIDSGSAIQLYNNSSQIISLSLFNIHGQNVITKSLSPREIWDYVPSNPGVVLGSYSFKGKTVGFKVIIR